MSDEDAPDAPPRAHAIENATGVPFEDWRDRLEAAGGRDLDHRGLARIVHERWDVTEWWAQGIAVAYEQSIGRREVGQSSAGDFAASASRTLPGDPDAVIEAWDALMDPDRLATLGLEEPRRSSTETWRYWRADGEDGSRVAVNVRAKDPASASGGARSTLAIEHKHLSGAQERQDLKRTWRSVLDDLATTLEENA